LDEIIDSRLVIAGILPDIEIKETIECIQNGKDIVYGKAVQTVNAG
jgi:hypothetical protein